MSDRWQDQIGSMFGAEDREFAKHPADEARAREVLRHAREDGSSDDEILEVWIDHMNGQSTDADYRERNRQRIYEFITGRPPRVSLLDQPIELGSGFWSGLSVLLAIVAAILVAVGLNMIYREGYGSRIVGGDAYNYQIWATRGVAWVVAGAAAAGLACWSVLMGRSGRS